MTQNQWLLLQCVFQGSGILVGIFGAKRWWLRWTTPTMWGLWFLGVLCMIMVFSTGHYS